MTTITLPQGFTSIESGLPTHDRPVLAIRRSGYISCDLEVLTARYQPDYRPLSPWRDLSGDSVHDDGESILGWRECPEWFHVSAPTGSQIIRALEQQLNDPSYTMEATRTARATIRQVGENAANVVEAVLDALHARLPYPTEACAVVRGLGPKAA